MIRELALRTEYDHVDETFVAKNVDPRLGRGFEALNEKLRLVNDYEYVYERYPPELSGRSSRISTTRRGGTSC